MCVLYWEVAIAASALWVHLRFRAQGQSNSTNSSCHLLVQLKLLVRSSASNKGEAEQNWTELLDPREGMNSGIGAEGINW